LFRLLGARQTHPSRRSRLKRGQMIGGVEIG
jgi:hypothetical protein